MNWIEIIKPERFDGNEIYVLCIAALVIGILVFLQKKYKCLYASEFIFLWAFDHLFGITGDYILALPPLDLYDTFDQADAEVGDVLLHNIDYPLVVIAFVCIYALTRPRGFKKLFIILSGAFVGAMIEFVGVEFLHLYLYKRWNTFYSFLFYIFVFYINLFIYDKVHEYIIRKKQSLRIYK